MNLLHVFERAPAAFPDGLVGYAVGDIHGRADLLAQMLDHLEERADADRRCGLDPVVVFLGDYVDRGPDSKGVIDLLLEGRPRGFQRRFLKGNHEQSMLGFINAPLANRAWFVLGGAETLMSYGVRPPPSLHAGDQDWIDASEQLKAAAPPSHLEFLEGLERYVVLGDYVFVHAGVDVGRPLERQTDDDLYWSRERFIAGKRRFSHRVVHGHTPVDEPFADARRVAVDTGAYASGVLTAARFEGRDVTFVSVSDRRPARKAVSAE